MKKLIIAIVLDLIILAGANYGLAIPEDECLASATTKTVTVESRPIIWEGELPPYIQHQDPLRTAYLIVDEFGNIQEVSKEEYEGYGD